VTVLSKKVVVRVLKMDMEAVTSAIYEILDNFKGSEEQLEMLRLLTVKVNELWEGLQKFLPKMVEFRFPEGEEWYQIHCHWVALFKEKRTLDFQFPILAQLVKYADEYLDGREIHETLEKDLWIEFHSATSKEENTEALLRMAALYYYVLAKNPTWAERYFRRMRQGFITLRNKALDQLDPGALALFFVHAEHLDQMDFEEVKALFELKRLGYLSWWHLLQAPPQFVRHLPRHNPDGTELGKLVLEALTNT
jgi:hypothetical protein